MISQTSKDILLDTASTNSSTCVDRTNYGSRYISDEGLQSTEHATGKTPTPYACKHCGANLDLEVEIFKHLARKHDEYPLEADYIIE